MRKFLAALMLISLMLCSVAYADDDVIKVGVFNCLTGQNAFGGQLELEGTQLAHSLNPEILGKKGELIIVDKQSLSPRMMTHLLSRWDQHRQLLRTRMCLG